MSYHELEDCFIVYNYCWYEEYNVYVSLFWLVIRYNYAYKANIFTLDAFSFDYINTTDY